MKEGHLMQNGSVEIIGGADGPTTIFVTSSFSPFSVLLVAAAAVLVVGAVVLAVYQHGKNKKG
jgi:Na+-transporting methylmalonyl-CoA/oxaloacetate decarboxylase beta subunit